MKIKSNEENSIVLLSFLLAGSSNWVLPFEIHTPTVEVIFEPFAGGVSIALGLAHFVLPQKSLTLL